ncbi:hypothetical protein [Oscillatoria sp. FACHB-1407]|nr:hypothetical protein [Oscillatoria sp. FACHB-1407]
MRPLLNSQVSRFSEVAAAHQRAKSEQAIGKVVLQQES